MYPDGSRTSYVYEARGYLTQVLDGTGITTSSYDARGLTSTTQYPGLSPLSYTYDGATNRTGLMDPDGGRTTYTYDAQNRVSVLRNPFNETNAFAYDAQNRSNLGNMANGMAQGRTFDSAGRETQRRVRYNNQFGAVLALQYDATYDKVNNRLRQVELDGSVTSYSYDATNQLLTEWRTDATPANSFRLTYTYDNLGNRLSLTSGSGLTTYSYDVANGGS